jgi:hypothetical protein
MPILDMARKVCLTKHMEKQNKGMEKPPYLSLHTPEKAAMSQKIAQTRQIVTDYV